MSKAGQNVAAMILFTLVALPLMILGMCIGITVIAALIFLLVNHVLPLMDITEFSATWRNAYGAAFAIVIVKTILGGLSGVIRKVA